MPRRSRLSPLLWPILVLVGGVWLLSVGSAASSASVSRAPTCRNHHRRVSCLTIAAAPNPSTDGQSVTISGRLLGSRHRRALVVLWRRLPGQRHFHSTAATRTDRSGRYSMKVRLDGNRWWYATAHGFRSRTVHQRVAALITLASSDARAAPGDQVTFTGTVSPSHAGRQMALQQLGSAGWQTVAQGTLDRTSAFSIAYAFPSEGTYQLRTY